MAETLFPKRQRCKACGHGFKSHVLGGLFCSYRCAGHPEPTTDVFAAPRECAYERNGETVWKKRYRSESEVPESLRATASVSVYRCTHCLYLHTGTAVVRTAKETRAIRTLAELSEVLLKSRGSADRKVVAKVAGVLPIRIKEWEEGSPKADPAALFALLRLYRLSLSIGFR